MIRTSHRTLSILKHDSRSHPGAHDDDFVALRSHGCVLWTHAAHSFAEGVRSPVISSPDNYARGTVEGALIMTGDGHWRFSTPARNTASNMCNDRQGVRGVCSCPSFQEHARRGLTCMNRRVCATPPSSWQLGISTSWDLHSRANVRTLTPTMSRGVSRSDSLSSSSSANGIPDRCSVQEDRLRRLMVADSRATGTKATSGAKETLSIVSRQRRVDQGGKVSNTGLFPKLSLSHAPQREIIGKFNDNQPKTVIKADVLHHPISRSEGSPLA